MAEQTPRQRYEKRLVALRNERTSWVDHWRDLADHIQPWRMRYLQSNLEQNKGWKRNTNIINGTPTWAADVLSSGMMAGITSPARVWFRLTTPDPDLAEYGAVRSWLHIVEERLRQAFAQSNIYNCLHDVYSDLGTFCTSALYVDEDPRTMFRGYVLPIGRYMLANSAKLEVDSLYDELSMTVGQLVEKFGRAKCSANVQSLYDQGNLDQWVKVVHVLEPNREQDPRYVGPKGMAWKSCWFEAGSSADIVLKESGYHEFPVMAPRWQVTGEDVYGHGPGMEALGDARALQLLEKRKAQAVDKIVNPPMKGPMSLQAQRASILPGDVTYVDSVQGGSTFEPAMVVNPQTVGVTREAIQEHEQRIKRAYRADLWLMLSEQEGNITAREVAEKHEEKMLQLGPVMERLQTELLKPLIDRAYSILDRNGLLPPAPQELNGVDLKVDYISIMAQAQKMLSTSGIERLASFVGNLAAVNKDVLDKLDFDEMVDEYGNSLGVKPDLIRTDEQVAQLRQGRAQAQQAAQQAAMAQQVAEGAKTLSQADMSGDNGLTRLMSQLGPAAA